MHWTSVCVVVPCPLWQVLKLWAQVRPSWQRSRGQELPMVRQRALYSPGKGSLKGCVFLGTTAAQPEETQSHRNGTLTAGLIQAVGHRAVADPREPRHRSRIGLFQQSPADQGWSDPLPTVPQPPSDPSAPRAAVLPLPSDGAAQGQASLGCTR